MSKSFAFVGEGLTDFSVFQSALLATPGGLESTATQIQPPFDQLSNPDDQGAFGGGWKGVLAWCQGGCRAGNTPLDSVVLKNFSSVVIHVDADIADEPELESVGLSQPCPPAEDTVASIAIYIEALLQRSCGEDQSGVVFMIPSKATEAWIIASGICVGLSVPAVLECAPEPAGILYGKTPRFVRAKGGAIRKNTKAYSKHRSSIAASWQHITATCSCAEIFAGHLASCLSGATRGDN